jgi:metal-responsive CopG/Arc/MetJ family transcriptional regulator
MAERHQSAVAQVSNETVDYHMTENVTISLTSELVQKIDRLRGSVPRSRFVLDAFQDYLSHNDGNAWNVNL